MPAFMLLASVLERSETDGFRQTTGVMARQRGGSHISVSSRDCRIGLVRVRDSTEDMVTKCRVPCQKAKLASISRL